MLGCKKVRLGAWPRAGFPEPAAPPTGNVNGPGAPSARGLNGNPRGEVSAQKPLSRWFWSGCIRGGPGDQLLSPQHHPRSQRGTPRSRWGRGAARRSSRGRGASPDRGGGGVLPPDHRGGGEEGGWAARGLPQVPAPPGHPPGAAPAPWWPVPEDRGLPPLPVSFVHLGPGPPWPVPGPGPVPGPRLLLTLTAGTAPQPLGVELTVSS